MKISRKKWMQYVNNLAKADEAAYDLISDYLYKNDILSDEGFNEFVDYMYAVVLKYSEASSELAAQAYEALALAQGATIAPAVPAAPPTYNDVVVAARGTRRKSMNPNSYAQSGSRLVKRTGVDTMLNNALRDGAQFAWIPSGDTCPFCLMLASNGWQYASKKAIKNGHAEHVHANCDCTYAVRFSDDVDVEGYDPDALRERYLNAGDNQAERLNALRRAQYEQNKDYINAQKRVAYARRMASNGRIVWPKGGTKLTPEEFKELRIYAEQKGISVAGLKNSTIDKDLAKDVISRTSEMADKYSIREKLINPLQIDFSQSLDANDFAISYPDSNHIIYFNKDAYRNSSALIREYNALMEEGFFVKGTDYHAIAYHEMGHIIGDVYGIDGMKISKDILGIDNDSVVLEYLSKNLSVYSGKVGGQEIIAECFASVYGGGDNEFALKFIEECDKIIKTSPSRR